MTTAFTQPATAPESTAPKTRVLTDIEASRRSPRLYLGDSTADGIVQTIRESATNVVDEFLEGHGEKLVIARLKPSQLPERVRQLMEHALALNPELSTLDILDSPFYSVQDSARGIPMDFMPEYDMYHFEAFFMRPNAGRKMNDSQRQEYINTVDPETFDMDATDKVGNLDSAGTHGVGLFALSSTSRLTYVASVTDGVLSEMLFYKGINLFPEPIVTPAPDMPNGTFILWQPDSQEVFSSSKIPKSTLISLARSFSFSMPVEFVDFDGAVTEFPLVTPAGILAQETDEVVSKSFNSWATMPLKEGQTEPDKKVAHINIAIAPVMNGNYIEQHTLNNLAMSNGQLHTTATSAIAEFFKARGEEAGIKLKSADFERLISIVSRIRAFRPEFKNGQIKTDIQSGALNQHILAGIKRGVQELLAEESAKGSEWVEALVERAIQLAKERIKEDNLRKSISDLKSRVKTSKKNPLPEKFVGSESYFAGRKDITELVNVEGASAKGGVVRSRDSKTQCVYDFRGKIRQSYNLSYEEALQNKELDDIMKIYGVPIDTKGDYGIDFNIDDLKVNASNMLHDGDTDGAHIGILWVSFHVRFFPEMVRRGMLNFIQAPLFQATLKETGEKIFFASQKERDEFLADPNHLAIKDNKIDRNKGIGEMDDSDIQSVLMSDEGRTLINIQFDPDDLEVKRFFDIIFGDDTSTRKKHLMFALSGDENTSNAVAQQEIDSEVIFDNLDLDNSNLDIEVVNV